MLGNLHTLLLALCVLPYQTSPLIRLNTPENRGEQVLCILARHGATIANYYQQYRISYISYISYVSYISYISYVSYISYISYIAYQEDEQLAFKDVAFHLLEE